MNKAAACAYQSADQTDYTAEYDQKYRFREVGNYGMPFNCDRRSRSAGGNQEQYEHRNNILFHEAAFSILFTELCALMLC